MRSAVQERRQFPRQEVLQPVAINLVQPRAASNVEHLNVSKGGLCLRLQETLEVRSVVRLQLNSVECTGRVAWVIQRLDLRDRPPFLFDVGIEFVDPPPKLRQLLAQRGGSFITLKSRPLRSKALEPAVIHGRHYVPRVERQTNHSLHWHLVVSSDGVPCFSSHYPSERDAIAGWMAFKRQQSA